LGSPPILLMAGCLTFLTRTANYFFMRETKFIEQNKEKWAEFEEMLKEGRPEPERLNELFVQITDDLSYARTFYPNRSVRMFLNRMAQWVFLNVYRGRQFPVERFRRFWSNDLPKALWESRSVLFLSFCLFALAFGIGVVSSMIDPDFARIILGEEYINMTLQNIENGDPMKVYKNSGPFGMTVGIALNNLFVALRTAIFGVLASVGTVFILLYNGIMVGAFQYFFIEHGVFWQSFLTIWIHGTLEISAIIIAGAAGLVAGSGLLFPGTYTRIQAFQLSVRRGLKIFLGIVPVVILAAIFEGFLTRYTETPPAIRAAFILLSLAFVLWYYVWYPRHKARTGTFSKNTIERELPPTQEQGINFSAIKSSGEVISEIFAFLHRHSKLTWMGITGAAAFFSAWVFIFSNKKPYEVFDFSHEISGVWAGTPAFFSQDTAPFLLMVQLLILTLLSTGAFRALQQEIPEQAQLDSSSRDGVMAAGVLLLPASLFILLFRVETGAIVWPLAIIATPFLSLWAAVIWFETRQPLKALSRAFSLFRRDQCLGLGFLTINLGLSFLFALGSPIWRMVLEFFSWLVPTGGNNISNYSAIITTAAAAVVLYFIYLMNLLAGGLIYFSNREITDASSLHRGIEKVGTTQRIRGLAKE